MRAVVSDGAVAAETATWMRTRRRSPLRASAANFKLGAPAAAVFSGSGSSGGFFTTGLLVVALNVDSLHRQIAKLQSALVAAKTGTANAPVIASSVSKPSESLMPFCSRMRS